MSRTARARSLVVVSALALGAAACASAALQTRPQDVPGLELRVAQAPNDRAAAVQLGAAYVAAQRYEDARRVLQPIVASSSADGAAFLYLGIASEELSDFAAARAAYQSYLDTGHDRALKEDIRGRLALLARKEMKQQAQAMLQREQVVSAEPPTPRTVAVLPFSFNAPNDELKPLQTALADMMITDLSVSPAIVPVERVRLQALLDEMLLGQAGLSDGAATIRAGRLLKAENLVQGAITIAGDQVRVDGAVLLTEQRSSRGQVSGENAVSAIFDLEKQLVFRIYELLGVTLTAAERERINENRSANLIAFLSYGRGLEALDRGSYTEASTFFNRATQVDPSFSRALENRRQATQLREAGAITLSEIVVSGARETKAGITSAAPTVTGNTLLTQITNDVNYSPGQNLTQQGNTGDGSAQSGQTRNNGGQEAQGGGSGGLQGALRAILTITIPRPGS
jgi:tetratricopeptide (TPR) repeat protein